MPEIALPTKQQVDSVKQDTQSILSNFPLFQPSKYNREIIFVNPKVNALGVYQDVINISGEGYAEYIILDLEVTYPKGMEVYVDGVLKAKLLPIAAPSSSLKTVGITIHDYIYMNGSSSFNLMKLDNAHRLVAPERIDSIHIRPYPYIQSTESPSIVLLKEPIIFKNSLVVKATGLDSITKLLPVTFIGGVK